MTVVTTVQHQDAERDVKSRYFQTTSLLCAENAALEQT